MDPVKPHLLPLEHKRSNDMCLSIQNPLAVLSEHLRTGGGADGGAGGHSRGGGGGGGCGYGGKRCSSSIKGDVVAGHDMTKQGCLN